MERLPVRKLIIFVTLPLVLIVGAGIGAALYGLIPGFDPVGMLRQTMNADEATYAYLDAAPPTYAEAPPDAVIFQFEEFAINLRTEQRLPVFMLLNLALEMKDGNAQVRAAILEPKLRDAVIVHVSSFGQEDLHGYDGFHSLRDGLWVRMLDIIGKEDLLNLQILKMSIK